MKVNLDKLDFSFSKKPVLVGGRAMEYYGLRKAGDDTDLIIPHEDYDGLLQKYPENKKDIFGDLGVIIHGFEIWRTIRWFDYNFYSKGAIEEENVKVISIEKLLFMKALTIDIPKYEKDLRLIVDKINKLSFDDRKKLSE